MLFYYYYYYMLDCVWFVAWLWGWFLVGIVCF